MFNLTKKRGYAAALLVVLLVLLSSFSVNKFLSNMRKFESETANNNLLVTANNGAEIISATFDRFFSELNSIAPFIEQYDDFTVPQVKALLQDIAKSKGYERFAIDFPNGKTYTSDGKVFDMSHYGYLDKIKAGEAFVTDVLPALADDKNVVSIFVPLHDKNGLPKASLRLSISTAALTDCINLTLFDSEGYYHLIDENGKYVANVVSSNALLMDVNFFEAIDKLEYNEGFSRQMIYDCFEKREACFLLYKSEGAGRYAYCQPININNWVLMTIVPSTVIQENENYNIKLALIMTVELALILFIAFGAVFYIQLKAQRTAKLNDKCFRVLAEQSGKVMFEWDFADNSITTTSNFKALFGREMVTRDNPVDALTKEMVHPDDEDAFNQVFKLILGGQNFENIKFRIKRADGEYHWCSLDGVVVTDFKGRPYKAIGSLEDINDFTLNQLALQHKAETDQLTGLYNKATTEFLITKLLSDEHSKDKSFALVIIDIDNFKILNDTLGHQHGDDVLRRMAQLLQPHVRKTDIMGRIGGDEFFLFFNNIDMDEIIKKKLADICADFKAMCTKEELDCGISLSGGVSFYPREADSFDQLYKQADIALYRTKRSGKNGYIVYNQSFGTEVNNLRTIIDHE